MLHFTWIKTEALQKIFLTLFFPIPILTVKTYLTILPQLLWIFVKKRIFLW